MIDLCLFDFDNTLVMTDDLKDIRERGRNQDSDRSYRTELESLIGDIASRLIYTEEDLQKLRAQNPDTKFALFTLAPLAYLEVIDNLVYPNFHWDTVIFYESITENRYKPNGFGIEMTMERFGLLDPSRVAMVGDSIKDIESAYNAGCYAVLDQTSWPEIKTERHWSAIKLIPDLTVKSKSQLSEFLRDPSSFLPALESLLDKNCSQTENFDLRNLRFDSTYYFAPHENIDFNRRVEIHCAGRLFTNYKSLEARRIWHNLTESIHKQKDIERFEISWLYVILGFIENQYKALHLRKRPLIVSTIPDRSGRIPRQRALIEQLYRLYQNTEPNSARNKKIKFITDIFEFKSSARSNSADHLSRTERFDNLANNLFIPESSKIPGNDYLIIDDVVTSGASLMYARKKLKEAGARNVTLFALAKTITNLK